MNLVNLIAIPIVVAFAWAKGRGLLKWAVLTWFFGFWCLLPLFMLKNKVIKIYHLPQPVKDFITARRFKDQLKVIEYPIDIQKEV